MDFEVCKNGWSGPEYNHLDREQRGKLEDSVDIKPGGILVKVKIDKQPVSPKCRVCGTKEEKVIQSYW